MAPRFNLHPGALLVLATSLALACCQSPPQESAPTPVSEPAERDAPEESTKADEVRKAIGHMKVRQRCNRVMGCEPAVRLAQHGALACDAMIVELTAAGRADGYWVPKMVDLLGQLEHAPAIPLLSSLLDDGRWEVRARAAQALGRIADPALEALLQRHLAGPSLEGDVGYHAALLFALSRCAPATATSNAETLASILGNGEEFLGRLNPGFFAFAIEVVRDLQVRAALPAARLASVHHARWPRLQGLRTLAAFRDKEGVPYAISRLSDRLPSVRNAALDALRRITQIREFSTADEWIAWCANRDCMKPVPRLERPPGYEALTSAAQRQPDGR